jgi:hypothetical protein
MAKTETQHPEVELARRSFAATVLATAGGAVAVQVPDGIEIGEHAYRAVVQVPASTSRQQAALALRKLADELEAER